MRDEDRPNSRIIRIAAIAMGVVVAAVAAGYLLGPASDPRTTASVSAPVHSEPENLAAPPNPSGGSKP
ncbi:hypothetical protein GCM10010924_39360 [Rhizobium wenxiniae]|nr:hypothetical protein GCM10010924_39360 [Rhizobium wenxiniae]